MKKKVLLLVLALAILGSGVGFAKNGLGVFASLPVGQGLPVSVMASLKFDSVPLVFGIGASIGTHTRLGVTADYWIANNNLVSVLNWYIGIGAYVGLGVSQNYSTLDLGVRVPIGLNVFVFDRVLEFFAELAPTLGASFSDPVTFPVLGLQAGLGARIWF